MTGVTGVTKGHGGGRVDRVEEQKNKFRRYGSPIEDCTNGLHGPRKRVLPIFVLFYSVGNSLQ